MAKKPKMLRNAKRIAKKQKALEIMSKKRKMLRKWLINQKTATMAKKQRMLKNRQKVQNTKKMTKKLKRLRKRLRNRKCLENV